MCSTKPGAHKSLLSPGRGTKGLLKKKKICFNFFFGAEHV